MQNMIPTGEAGSKEPEVSDARKALVAEWLEKIELAQKHHAKAFKKMRQNMAFAARGADKEWIESDQYVVPIINRHINLSVAKLYAKNPTAAAKRRPKMMYQLWDERPESLMEAVQGMTMGDPMSAAIIQEVVGAQNYNRMIDRSGRTLEILWQYFLGEQGTNYKQQLKAMVRRTKVCSVGYIKIGFQRAMKPNPEPGAIDDITSKIRGIERILYEVSEGKTDQQSANMEQLRTSIADLQKQPAMLTVREGPIFDFPRANEITIDPACRHLKTFTGADWISHDMEMSAERVYEIYKVDLKESGARPYHKDGRIYDAPVSMASTLGDKVVYRVHEIQDKRNRQCLTVVDGYKDFLKGPYTPDVDLERFWTVFPLVFNEIEHDEELYPPSDVENARHIQQEYNRSRQGLREHRIAARPYWVTDGSVEDEEKAKLAMHDAHQIIEMPSLAGGQKISDKLMAGPTAPIDPNLYETEMHFTDLQRVVGTQEANFGSISGGTATESSIAESSRGDSNAENVDDLDELLSDVAHAFGQVCLMNLSKETVVEIAGPGAVWPEMPPTREEVVKDLQLTIKAGSSGRPNQAQELANTERALPMIIQLPGVNPRPLVEKYSALLDVPLDELAIEGMPSISALNALMAKGPTAGNGGEQPTGDPATDPNQQGAQGSTNAPNPVANEPGPQPGFPAPAPIAA